MVISSITAIGVGLTTDVLNNTRIKNIPVGKAARIRILATGAGIVGDLSHVLFVGERNPLEGSAVSILDRTPIDPDDEVIAGVPGIGGEVLVLNVTNSSAGILNYFLTLVVDTFSLRNMTAPRVG